MLVGGGTSIMPRTAPILYDFVEADNGEYLEAAEAVFRIFDRQDWLRANRARARIKVFVDKFGIDELRRAGRRGAQGRLGQRARLRRRRSCASTTTRRPSSPSCRWPTTRSRTATGPSSSVGRAQRQAAAPAGLQHGPGERHPRRPVARAVPRPRADHARLLRRLRPHDGRARTSSCAGCATRRPTPSGSGSRELGLANPGADTVIDTVSCPGTDSCKLGITSSMGLNRAIHDRVEQMNITDPLTKKIHIKMSGCPNGCGQHHIGNIGFYGASIKVGDKTIPAYVAHIGGRYEGGAGVVFGQRLKIRLPAKRVPDAVERWIRFYEAERDEGETFNQFAERVGLAAFEEQAKDLSIPVEFNLENIEHFIDWSRREPYQVDPRGGRMRGLAAAPDRDPRSRAAQRRGGARLRRRGVLAAAVRGELVPEGGVGRHGHAPEDRPRGALLHARHRLPLPRDLRDLEAARGALRDRDRGLPGDQPGAPGGAARRGALEARSGQVLRDPQGRSDARGARRRPTPGSRVFGGSTRPVRTEIPKLGWDAKHGLYKVAPLADWSDKDVWRYIFENDVPYNPLHDHGFESIGCTHCTQAGCRPRRALGRD